MKILYVCSNFFDYQQDLIYAGLVKILGSANVIDHPWNPKFHLPLKEYPKNLGYTSLSLRLPLFNNFKNFDIVILASAKKDALATYSKILPYIMNTPVVFLDGGDYPEVGGDFYRYGLENDYENIIKIKPFNIILKREYINSLHSANTNIYPFPFSFPYNVHIPTANETDKKYDVSFWGQPNPAIRTEALKLLHNKYDCAKNGTTLDQHFDAYKRKGKFYLEELSKCKIVLNFRGGGWDTMRYWEVPAVGSLMISQQPQILIPHNFEDSKNVVWCSDSLDDLIEKIDHYLTHTEERERIAINGKEHLQKYHLNTARATELIKIIKTIL